MKWIFIVYWIAMCVLMCSCQSVPSYNVALSNTGLTTVYEAHVRYDGFRSAGGILSSGALSTHLLPDYPIPDSAVVEWKTEDGRFHSQQVAVKGAIPKPIKLGSTLVFQIDGANKVTLRVEEPWRFEGY